MAQQAQQMQVKVSYGHNDTHVLVRYSRPVELSLMTIEQAEAMLAELANAIAALKAHQAKAPAANG